MNKPIKLSSAQSRPSFFLHATMC